MVQSSDGASFLLETRRVLTLELFNRDNTVQPRVASFINLTHAARPNRRKDFIRAEFVASRQWHRKDSAKSIAYLAKWPPLL